MNKKTYYTNLSVFAILFVSLFVSCSDSYYEADMGGRITPDQHYKSLDDVQSSFDGCKALMQDIAENQILVDGLRSDQMIITENADPDMIEIVQHELSANNPYIDPSNYYKLIINVNEILPYLPKVMEIDRDFDSVLMEGYKGQFITMRSWAYFNLARLNGEVAFANESDPSEPPVYRTKLDAINQIISTLLPYNDEDDLYRYYLDLYVLLGELYLEKGDYANAKKFLKFACDGPYYAIGDRMYMVDNVYGLENWRNIFLDAIYQVTTVRTATPYSFITGQQNTLEEWMHIDYAYQVKPTSIMVSAYENEVQQNNDPSDLYRGLGNAIDTLPSGEDYYINKYSIDLDLPHSADAILYRAADIHLLLAEAMNQLGETTNALTLLNKGFGGLTGGERPPEFRKWAANAGVRGRVYLQELSASGVNEVEDLLLEERSKELAFEGKRWFDLVRIAERRGDPAYLANKVAAKFEDPALADEIRNKLMNPESWYLPIPR